jgi:membrane protease YdiL (CAAX protease family)
MTKVVTKTPISKTILAVLIWLILFGCTVQVGFSTWLFDSLFDAQLATILGAILNIVLLVLIIYMYRKSTQKLFQIKSWRTVIPYAILLVAAVLVPFHYHFELPVAIYIFFISVSVFWQDYLTFGLLQGHLRREVSLKITLILMPILFLAAHLIFLPNFWTQPFQLVMVVVMAVVFALIRDKTGELHWPIFIHLLFYLAFC